MSLSFIQHPHRDTQVDSSWSPRPSISLYPNPPVAKSVYCTIILWSTACILVCLLIFFCMLYSIKLFCSLSFRRSCCLSLILSLGLSLNLQVSYNVRPVNYSYYLAPLVCLLPSPSLTIVQYVSKFSFNLSLGLRFVLLSPLSPYSPFFPSLFFLMHLHV